MRQAFIHYEMRHRSNRVILCIIYDKLYQLLGSLTKIKILFSSLRFYKQTAIRLGFISVGLIVFALGLKRPLFSWLFVKEWSMKARVMTSPKIRGHRVKNSYISPRVLSEFGFMARKFFHHPHLKNSAKCDEKVKEFYCRTTQDCRGATLSSTDRFNEQLHRIKCEWNPSELRLTWARR